MDRTEGISDVAASSLKRETIFGEGAGYHTRAAGVVEEGDGIGVLGDADEVEVLLDVVCDLEGELVLPGFCVVFGGKVVEEGAVGGCEVGG